MKWFVIAGVFLFIIELLWLYACVRLASKADKQISDMFKQKTTDNK